MLATRTDVLVRTVHDALTPEDEARLDEGAGLVVVGGGAWDPTLLARVTRAGILPRPCEPERTGLAGDRAGLSAVTAEDLLARVEAAEGTVGASLELSSGAAPLLRSGRGVVVAAVADRAPGRVAVVAADLPEARWVQELVHNLWTWVAPRAAALAPAAER
ncbi:hypothetical protein, partial [Actinotalea ferrariae]|uniref:hypothetical protein n=1 Tax=Actinotalea ferrariae TaxID=1386098 RepID=UPI0005574337